MSKNFLNKEQNEAVDTISGPLLVLAGAGTGKTGVITHRIANMLKNWISPKNILALTFTNKAAREMKERVGTLVNKESSQKLFIGTFHAFCIMILKKETRHIPGLHPGFTIADEIDQKAIFKQVIAELGYNDMKIDINVYRSIISNAKNELLSPEAYSRQANGYFEKIAAMVYKKYQNTLKLQNMVDFDDILLKVVEMWQDNKEVLEKYQEIYKYLLVDEFQDTNHVQFQLIKLLAGARQNICVVGDDDQSIYSWRGAKVENILDFAKKFKNTKTIKLEQNYRSTNNILKAANMFIAGNQKRHEKNLWSSRGDGEKILYESAETDIEEASFVSGQIYKFIYGESKINYKDIAILYRSNHQSRLFEKAFRNDDIPYRLVGSKSFYERKEIRDATAYLKLCVNQRDDQSLLRIIGVPARGLGAKAIEKLRELQSNSKDSLSNLMGKDSFKSASTGRASSSASSFSSCLKKWAAVTRESGNIADKVKNYFAEIGFLNGFQKMYKNIEEAEARRDNVIEFINAIAQYEKEHPDDASLIGFLEAFSLSDDNDKVDEDESDNAVTLLTIHASKGLEFPYVFLVGMEEGLFPNYRALDEGNLDEERRLFYVAVTRAKDKLIISNAKTRFKYGKSEYQIESKFIEEIPDELLEEKNVIPVESKSVSRAFEAFYEQFSD
jgi:DNA helicase II / ATP-dependent DNA helicase PcrA